MFVSQAKVLLSLLVLVAASVTLIGLTSEAKAYFIITNPNPNVLLQIQQLQQQIQPQIPLQQQQIQQRLTGTGLFTPCFPFCNININNVPFQFQQFRTQPTFISPQQQPQLPTQYHYPYPYPVQTPIPSYPLTATTTNPFTSANTNINTNTNTNTASVQCNNIVMTNSGPVAIASCSNGGSTASAFSSISPGSGEINVNARTTATQINNDGIR